MHGRQGAQRGIAKKAAVENPWRGTDDVELSYTGLVKGCSVPLECLFFLVSLRLSAVLWQGRDDVQPRHCHNK